MSDVLSLPSMELLKQYIHQTLCAKDNLDIEQTPLQSATLFQRGKPCGIFFQVKGPRLLKNYAIWTGDQNRILFYDATGERFGETLLSDGPDPRRLAA